MTKSQPTVLMKLFFNRFFSVLDCHTINLHCELKAMMRFNPFTGHDTVRRENNGGAEIRKNEMSRQVRRQDGDRATQLQPSSGRPAV